MALRKSTRVWLILLAAAVLFLVAGGLWDKGTALTPLGVVLLVIAGFVLALRGAVLLSQRLFYRLSWRLAFSYLLIGVFPVPLVALLLGIAAAMSLGQFEAYRVDQAVRQLGSRILAGEVPGVLKARIVGAKVVSSQIPQLPRGSAAPVLLPSLSEPRFVGERGDEPP